MKGLYFTSSLVSIRYIAVLGFQLLVGNLHDEAGRSFLSAISRYLVSNVQDVQVFLWDRYVFPSAISRYLVSNGRINIQVSLGTLGFPSAISRYLVSNFGDGYIISCANGSFHPLYRGTWFPTTCYNSVFSHLHKEFPSAISRYLVSNPTRKTPPLTSGGGNGLHTPRRIDHIPTFASLNHDKNTRSTHYTPNAGIEFSQAGFAPPGINPVQNWV